MLLALPLQTKCVMEEAQENQRITGSYSAFNKENESQAVSVDARVRTGVAGRQAHCGGRVMGLLRCVSREPSSRCQSRM